MNAVDTTLQFIASQLAIAKASELYEPHFESLFVTLEQIQGIDKQMLQKIVKYMNSELLQINRDTKNIFHHSDKQYTDLLLMLRIKTVGYGPFAIAFDKYVVNQKKLQM